MGRGTLLWIDGVAGMSASVGGDVLHIGRVAAGNRVVGVYDRLKAIRILRLGEKNGGCIRIGARNKRRRYGMWRGRIKVAARRRHGTLCL